VAPAGSGKTTTLVARIAWRIATGTPPDAVCALTFNRRAAEELDERLASALEPLGIAPGVVRVRTFHALGREILADAGVDVTRIVDRRALLADLAGGPLPPASIRHLDDAFTRLALDPERGPPPDDRLTHAAWADYRAALRERGALDLDDLVARVPPTLREDPALLRRWRERAAVLFVDEAQDLDRTQLELAVLLAGDPRDIFLVGDDDQTIYAWRLADVRRVLGLAAALPGLHRVDLVTNHRCPPEVVRRAARLIEHGRERFRKRILPSPRTSGTLTLAPDTGDEVARARRMLAAWYGRTEGAYAVLARTNAELVPLAAAALEADVPYTVEDDGLVLDDPGVDAALDALSTSPPAYRATNVSVRTVLAWAPGYRTVAALRAAVKAARARRNGLRAQDARLVLATIHGTKGLEFDHVAVVGLDDGIFPSRRALEEATGPERTLEEERRLAYVAWTRARRSLTLVYDPDAPSIFMREAFEPGELAA
jgi:DNA helicase-2/ATP-dependent DNA helicase PcrA